MDNPDYNLSLKMGVDFPMVILLLFQDQLYIHLDKYMLMEVSTVVVLTMLNILNGQMVIQVMKIVEV